MITFILSPWYINTALQEMVQGALHYELQKVKERNCLRCRETKMWQKEQEIFWWHKYWTVVVRQFYADLNVVIIIMSAYQNCDQNCADCGKFYICKDISCADSESR